MQPSTARVTNLKKTGSILEEVRAIAVDTPTLCHDERLKPAGACRLCVVEVDFLPHATHRWHGHPNRETDALRAERKGVLSLLAQRNPREAIQQAPNKTFHGYLSRPNR